MSITAAQVKELRQRTSAAMMDCKKALQSCEGDMEQAIDWLRSKGQAKASKKADRQTAEGRITIAVHDSLATIIEINCETDFVGRDDNFIAFCDKVVAHAQQHTGITIDELMTQVDSASGQSLEEMRQQLIAKIGENIQVRRIETISSEFTLGSYIHGGRIGVILAMEGGDKALARDIAMHIAASAPQVIAAEDVNEALIARERAVFTAQAAESAKPEAIVKKMVDGRMKKFLSEISLLGQSFVKDPEQTVAAILQAQKAEVKQFIRFEVGEGMAKEESDFAAEVMAQVNRG